MVTFNNSLYNYYKWFSIVTQYKVWLFKYQQLWALKSGTRGAWVVQSVKRPAPDLGSGHDLMIHVIEPHVELCIGLRAAASSLLGILSPSLLPLPSSQVCVLPLSLSK